MANATARFPDGDTWPLDVSAARHAQTGDVLALEVVAASDETDYHVARVGIVTRRIWIGTDLRLDLVDHPAPTI